MSSTSKRLLLAALTLTLIGVSACADATSPRSDSAPCENQGSGGRTCQ